MCRSWFKKKPKTRYITEDAVMYRIIMDNNTRYYTRYSTSADLQDEIAKAENGIVRIKKYFINVDNDFKPIGWKEDDDPVDLMIGHIVSIEMFEDKAVIKEEGEQ